MVCFSGIIEVSKFEAAACLESVEITIKSSNLSVTAELCLTPKERPALSHHLKRNRRCSTLHFSDPKSHKVMQSRIGSTKELCRGITF